MFFFEKLDEMMGLTIDLKWSLSFTVLVGYLT